MLPEFENGEIIIIDPEGLARDGSFVVALHDGEHTFRQLVLHDGYWYLKPLNPRYPTVDFSGPGAVKGVITQKKRPGSRRIRKSYV
jgi:DNA polymerase V